MQTREAGQVLGGKYRLVRQLGQGGMGSVWHAEHLTLSSPVALKLIEPATAKEPDALQRFLREARTAAALRSPHVVQILDYGVDDDTPYIAMELLDGESLAERLSRVGKLGTRETARVIQHVARAIGRAHDAGIVHRDLKPENVFIVRNDDEEVIKVLDFGIVKASASSFGASAAPAATRTGTLLGTPYFMSPEQAEGEKSVDHRADIWALGVIAFKCLVGRLPFNGDSVGKLILEICSRPLPVPSQVATVPQGFDAWFARACARDPAARFESAKRAAAEFARLDDGVVAAPESIPARVAAASPEPPLAATTGHSTNSEIASRSTRPRSRRVLVALGAIAIVALSIWAVTRTLEPSADVPASSAPARGVALGAPRAKPPSEADDAKGSSKGSAAAPLETSTASPEIAKPRVPAVENTPAPARDKGTKRPSVKTPSTPKDQNKPAIDLGI